MLDGWIVTADDPALSLRNGLENTVPKMDVLTAILSSQGLNQMPFEVSNRFVEMHQSRVKHFDSLYRAVTVEMEKFRDRERLSKDKRQWLSYLIRGFQERFTNWIPNEVKYLEDLYNQRWDTLTLTGHAHLHVSYDLPIVIAQSFQAIGFSNDLIGQARASQIYMALEKGFSSAVRSTWKKPFLVNFLLWRPLKTDPIFLSWLIQLRNGAWIHAVYLASVPEGDLPAVQSSLHGNIERNLKCALRQFWLWSRIFSLRAPGALGGWSGAIIGSLPFWFLGSIASSELGIAAIIVLPPLFRVLFEELAMMKLNNLIAAFEPPSIDANQ
jgi:hypothetical protein